MISPAEVAEFLQVGPAETFGPRSLSLSSPRVVHVVLFQVDHLQKQCHLILLVERGLPVIQVWRPSEERTLGRTGGFRERSIWRCS